MADIRASDIVSSLAGHDCGRLYVVKSTDGICAELVDGKIRRLNRPKRKKLRHMEKRGETALGELDKAFPDTVTDKNIRTTLAIFKAEEVTRLGKR